MPTREIFGYCAWVDEVVSREVANRQIRIILFFIFRPGISPTIDQ
jgi:hypothetical protein